MKTSITIWKTNIENHLFNKLNKSGGGIKKQESWLQLVGLIINNWRVVIEKLPLGWGPTPSSPGTQTCRRSSSSLGTGLMRNTTSLRMGIFHLKQTKLMVKS